MNSTRRIAAAFGLVVLSLSLGACEDTKKMLGMDKRPPDEFTVYSRAPLSMPPNYDLRPPAPGESRPQENKPSIEAEAALRGRLAGAEGPAPSGSSPGTVALLRQTGALTAQPNIRALVNEDSAALAQQGDKITDKILFWRKPEDPSVVVNPEKETQRIKENQALGKPVTEGQTPVIERRKRGLF
ncbi:MAG: DUF3035 domain-containing protein [Alphaproteobacteria bacterium]|nr:DUF3035 domain-containing protein [Alphaproteobacteria bacterium]